MKLAKRIAIITFLVACTVLWTIMTLIDTGAMVSHDTKYIKFGTIALCFLFSLIHCTNTKSHLFIGAMLFTLISDFILELAFSFDRIWIALLTFSISQVLHMLDMKGLDHFIRSTIRRAIGFIILVVPLILLNGFNIVSILVAFYAANLILNIADSFTIKVKGKTFMQIGFILFLLCDICVGWTMSKFVGNPNPALKAIDFFTNFGMWLFYVPSQALLVFANYYRYEK